ncbi:MAG: B12-binding domain-containing radical SAM protein [Bryobacteraceae bacterium]
MRLSFVTAPIATDFEDAVDAASGEVRLYSAAPQLGILSLAAIVEQIGIQPDLVNLDQLYYAYLDQFGSRGLADFPEWVAPILAASGSEVYGFSSICSSYPTTIRIAACLKSVRPGCTILLGGPQASVVDLPTLAAFPFVDFILRGEAERTLPLFLDQWSGPRCFSNVPGLSYRSPFGPVRNQDAAIIEDLDSLPLPAYHLTNELEDAPRASLELGRGCPFACTFCSTNDFFRRKFRVKSPQGMLAGMRAIASSYGIRDFNLVHDMFTVDRRRVADFCRHMLESGDHFEWSCSARTDCVDEELLESMASAGCNGIFFGIESGSRRIQRIIDKDLDPDRAREMIDIAERLGIPTTVSLITGFPEENHDDLRDTIGMYMHSMRFPASSPQLNLLAPLAGTPVYAQYKDQMALEELCSDMSHQGRTQNEPDRELIRHYPHIFPNFYLLPAPGLDRAFCLELREFLGAGTRRLRWLLTALHQSTPGILDVFSEWRKRRLESHPDLNGGGLRAYYMQKSFADEFAAFTRERLPEFQSYTVEALVDCYEALVQAEACDAALSREHPIVSGPLLAGALPVRAPHLHVLELDCDIQEVIESLKCAEPLQQPHRTRKFYRTGETAEGASRLLEITPRVAAALETCDGLHSVDQFIDTLSERFNGPAELRRHSARVLLEGIRAKGFIEMYRAGPEPGWALPHYAPMAEIRP